jgi:hypothetical protein
MSAADSLTPATPEDLADALAFALRFNGRKRRHDEAVCERGVTAPTIAKAPSLAMISLSLLSQERPLR